MTKSIININITVLIILFSFLSNFVIGQNSLKEIKPKTSKYLKLLYPIGTESFEKGETINIEWESKGVQSIKIDYLQDDKWISIIDDYPASLKNYKWTGTDKKLVPFKIRISEYPRISAIFDTSPFFLKIEDSKNQFASESNQEINSSAIKIMPLGNSITHGYQQPLPLIFDGYRKSLKNTLVNHGLNLNFVGSKSEGTFIDNQHEGHGGWHSKHWYNNKKYSLADSLVKFLTLNPPDIILLHIGTNDIGEYFDSRNDDTIDSTVASVSGLLDTIYNFDPSIKVILAKIVNRLDDDQTLSVNESDTTTAFNIALLNMANLRIANGDNLSIVDMENALTYPDDLSDGVHPNDIGYEKMAQVWFDSIIEVLPKLNTKIYLEGAYGGSGMNINLNTAGVIPTTQPFNTDPWNYDGTEDAGNIPANVVDWVLVSLREDIIKSSEVACRAAFLKNDGSIVDLDGMSPLTFVVDEGTYYVVVEHSNHLPIMSPAKVTVQP